MTETRSHSNESKANLFTTFAVVSLVSDEEEEKTKIDGGSCRSLMSDSRAIIL